MGYGVSACATCDGFFFKDKQCSSSAAATPPWRRRIFLTKFASKVTVVHRRDDAARLEDHAETARGETRRSSSLGTRASPRSTAIRNKAA